MTIGIEGYTYRGYDLVHFTKTGVTLVHAFTNRKILHQAQSLEDAQAWVDRYIAGRIVRADVETNPLSRLLRAINQD